MTPLRTAVLVVLVVAIAVAAAASLQHPWLADAVVSARQHPRDAGALFVAAYVLATVLAVPGTILALAAGFLFGVPLGVPLVSAGSVLGAAAAFLVGRFVLRAWVARRIAGLPRFEALDAATHADGFAIVLLTRLSPLFPFNLLNYGFALTAVRFRDYVLASFIGMLPATVLHVYIGSLAKSVADLAVGDLDTGWTARVLLVVGLLATATVTVLVTRRATRTLRDRLAAVPCAAPRGGAQ